MQFDAIIVGQGYAGLKTASLAAAKGLKVAAVEAMFPGGLVMNINELHPAPEGEAPCGPELTGGLAMENMDNVAHNVTDAEVTEISRAGSGLWRVKAGAETLEGKVVVIATGARLRKLGVAGEAELEGRGVSSCADCDGPLYQGKQAVIVGGGDAAFQEAVALAIYAGEITILVRGDAPRARQELVDAVAALPNVSVVSNATVEEILGSPSEGVTAVRIAEQDAGTRDLPCSAVFAFIGLEPASEFLPADVTRDGSGAVATSDGLETNIPGLYAIGAVRSGFGGLLSDAAVDAERVVAALS
jgi:thioredoxin reductase (NADPH)